MRTAAEASYLFFACWLLAQVEIQIEGAHGWAEKLPTWRLKDPRLLRLTNGKPVTGYHVYLTGFLLCMFHLPVLFTPWSAALEARLLSMYFLTTITWDFQWFVWNPAWGPARFFRDPVWWFPVRLAGLPVEYYLGASYSLLTTALLRRDGVRSWAVFFSCLLGWSALTAAAAGALRRPSR